MRDHSSPAEFSPGDPERELPLFDAAFLSATWHDSASLGAAPDRSDRATAVAATLLLLGIALLWFVPLGGALLLVTAGLGLALSAETSLAPHGAAPSLTKSTSTTASWPLIPSAKDT